MQLFNVNNDTDLYFTECTEEIIMSELKNKKLNEEELASVAGGNDGMGDGTFSCYDIAPVWVMVTADSLNCRYWPNGQIAKTYEYGQGSQTQSVCSLSRHSPYTAKSNPCRFRASSARPCFDFELLWLRLGRNEPCRQVRKRRAFAHCRGIRRIQPARQMLFREQAPDEHLTTCPCMAHC